VLTEEYIERLRTFIWQKHQVRAKHRMSVYVWEAFRLETIWEGNVEVFDLLDHPAVNRCYAWADASGEITVVLETPTIRNASDAIRVYLEDEGTAR
jgi:hypothetical protein